MSAVPFLPIPSVAREPTAAALSALAASTERTGRTNAVSPAESRSDRTLVENGQASVLVASSPFLFVASVLDAVDVILKPTECTCRIGTNVRTAETRAKLETHPSTTKHSTRNPVFAERLPHGGFPSGNGDFGSLYQRVNFTKSPNPYRITEQIKTNRKHACQSCRPQMLDCRNVGSFEPPARSVPPFPGVIVRNCQWNQTV